MKMLMDSKIAQKARYAMFMTMFNRKGMEMVQVAILVAIAVAIGIVFKDAAKDYVNTIFSGLATSFN